MMGACGGKEERNGDDDGNMIEGNSTSTPMIVLEDVSTLEPIKAETTTKKKRGKRFKKNLSRNQPEFGIVSPRSRSLSIEELTFEETENKEKSMSDTTVEDIDEENNIDPKNETSNEPTSQDNIDRKVVDDAIEVKSD